MPGFGFWCGFRHQLGRPGGAVGGGVVSSPIYAELVARPTPTGTVRTVTTAMSAATIAATYASCVSGDCLEFDDGTYSQPDCFPSGFNKAGVIIRAKNRGAYTAAPLGPGTTPHHARFSRNVTFTYDARLGGTTSNIAADNVTIHDIWHKLAPGIWPADNALWSTVLPNASSSYAFIQLAQKSDSSYPSGAQLLYNEFSMGYGPTNTPFDPTFKYPDCNSPNPFLVNGDGTISAGGTNTGWGDATWLTYNRLLHGPYAISCPSQRVANGITVYGNYFHDLSHCVIGLIPAAGAFLFAHNWHERSYHDFGTQSTGNTTAPASIDFLQNVYLDPCGHKYDNGNPHVDTNQLFYSTAGTNLKLFNLRSARNLLASTSALTRGPAQFNFFQLSASHYPAGGANVVAVAPKIRENIGIMGGSIYAAMLAVSEDAYVRGNEVWHPVKLSDNTTADVVQTQLVMESAMGIGAARTNRSLLADNVLEADVAGETSSTPAVISKINNVLLGSRIARTVDESLVFTGSTAAWPGATPAPMFSYRLKQPAHATKGTAAANIVDFLMAPIDWTGERPFLGFVDSLGQTHDTVITSNPAWVHGGDPGDALAIVPGAGVEWRTLAKADRTTQVLGWSSSPGTVTVDGDYVQLRVTTPAQGVQTSFSVTLGGVAQTWAVGSVSTAAYPAVTFDAATPDKLTQASAAGLGPDGQVGTLALMGLSIAAAPAATQSLLGISAGSVRVSIQILNTGKLRINLLNAAGTTIARMDTAASIAGGTHDIIASWDLSQANLAAGTSLYIDGAPSQATGTTFTSGATVNYSYTGGSYVFGAFDGSLKAFYLNTAARVDLTNVANLGKFNADQIGTNGAGPTGSSPRVFLVGNAAQWNDATNGINFGTAGVKWKLTSGAVADATAGQAAWA